MTVPLTPLDDRCEAISDDGFRCILTEKHQGAHMRYPCYGDDCEACGCGFEHSYPDDDFENVEP